MQGKVVEENARVTQMDTRLFTLNASVDTLLSPLPFICRSHILYYRAIENYGGDDKKSITLFDSLRAEVSGKWKGI